jgi:hypothetical protein
MHQSQMLAANNAVSLLRESWRLLLPPRIATVATK